MPVAEALRKRGFSVVAAVETPPRGLDDDVLLRRATRMGRVLVTHNRRDFVRVVGEFRQSGEPHLGVVVLPRDISQERLLLRTAMMLDWRATLPEPPPDLLLWNGLQRQLIRGLRLAGYTEDEVRLVLGWRPA